jgi:hypothetical protein
MPNEIIVVTPPEYTATTAYGSNTVPSTEESAELAGELDVHGEAEFENFEETLSKLAQVPKSEVDEKRKGS